MVLSFLKKKENKKTTTTTKKVAVAKKNENQGELRTYRAADKAQEEVKKASLLAQENPELTIAGLDISKNVLEEAAIYFANGNPSKSIEVLVARLNESSGQVDKNEWYMIFDAYQATGQQSRFEKLALFFSSLFDTSPPSWEAFNQGDKKNRDAMGRSALNIDGSISDLQDEKIKDFLSASKESKTCRIDFSRIKLLENDEQLEESLIRLLKMMYEIKKNRIMGQIMGDMNFISLLKDNIAYFKENNDFSDKNKCYWLILCELYQWHGKEDEFEDLALDYAMSFEESPPSYLERHVMKTTIETDDEYLDDDGFISADSIIDRQNIEKLISHIDEQLKLTEKVTVNFKYVNRLDFYAAGELAKYLGNLGIDNTRIIIRFPLELIITLFDITGVSSFVSYIHRKR